jgi:hypothetical protein
MTKDAYEMFELISGVYFGKQYYFEDNNDMVYSRLSHSYMTKDDALGEFLDEIQSYEGPVTYTASNHTLTADEIAKITNNSDYGVGTGC